MSTRVEQAGIYGFVNGLGYSGDAETKSRLIKTARRAANRGDWDLLFTMGLAYVLGSAVGSSFRGQPQRASASAVWPGY